MIECRISDPLSDRLTITTTPRRPPDLKGVFLFEVKNLLDKTYIASANNITGRISAAPGTRLAFR